MWSLTVVRPTTTNDDSNCLNSVHASASANTNTSYSLLSINPFNSSGHENSSGVKAQKLPGMAKKVPVVTVQFADRVFCNVCEEGKDRNLLHDSQIANIAFISIGFCDWKHAIARFDGHEKSQCHRLAIVKTSFVNEEYNLKSHKSLTIRQTWRLFVKSQSLYLECLEAPYLALSSSPYMSPIASLLSHPGAD